MGSIIHMENEEVLLILRRLENQYLQGKEQLSNLRRAVNILSTSWISSKSTVFRKELREQIQYLDNQLDELGLLVKKGYREVDEWIEVDSRFSMGTALLNFSLPDPQDIIWQGTLLFLKTFYSFLEEIRKFDRRIYTIILSFLLHPEIMLEIIGPGYDFVGFIVNTPGALIPYTPGLPINCRTSPIQPAGGIPLGSPGMIMKSENGYYFLGQGGVKTPLAYDPKSGCYQAMY